MSRMQRMRVALKQAIERFDGNEIASGRQHADPLVGSLRYPWPRSDKDESEYVHPETFVRLVLSDFMTTIGLLTEVRKAAHPDMEDMPDEEADEITPEQVVRWVRHSNDENFHLEETLRNVNEVHAKCGPEMLKLREKLLLRESECREAERRLQQAVDGARESGEMQANVIRRRDADIRALDLEVGRGRNALANLEGEQKIVREAFQRRIAELENDLKNVTWKGKEELVEMNRQLGVTADNLQKRVASLEVQLVAEADCRSRTQEELNASLAERSKLAVRAEEMENKATFWSSLVKLVLERMEYLQRREA